MDPRSAVLKKFAGQTPPGGLDVILRYATDPPLAQAALVKAIREGLPEAGRVIELGFGSGWLLELLVERFPSARRYALDMAPAFMASARRTFGGRIQFIRGDMERLPLLDRSFDVVTTNWTLYFMNDIAATVDGIRRCLRPGGRLVAATNAPDHMHEFTKLADACLREVLGREPERDMAQRFDTSTGMPYVQQVFARVELREWSGELVLLDTESALALLPNWGPQQLSDSERPGFVAEFARRVGAILRREGRWRVTRHDGAFVAET